MDTIFAEATPPGRGGVSIIRISGPASRAVAEQLCGALPEARRGYFRTVRDGSETIDQALVIRFEEGASFTGEETVEFHLHGAPVVVRRLEKALLDRGLRIAEAGEFTLRAFLAGRIDLAEAEGLSDLLAAETELQRQQATSGASGELGRKAESWRARLVQAGAMLTAAIDFADEDVPDDVDREVGQWISQVAADIKVELQGYPSAARLREGFEVALVGAPNAGKSSLLNAFARQDIAIVTEHAGTTRDVLEFRADVQGLPVTFLDTAGLRDSDDPVELVGMERALKRAGSADLRIFVGAIPEGAEVLWRQGDICVETKGDLTGLAGSVSALTGEGIDGLLSEVRAVLSERVSTGGLVSHERQASALAEAMVALENAEGADVEIKAECIRSATHHIRRLVGKIDAEEYLDLVFSQFCIGK